MLISTALSSFMLALEADGLNDKTLTWYREILIHHPDNLLAWLAAASVTALEQVTVDQLRAYVVELRRRPNAHTGAPRSQATINAHVRALHKFWNWCSEEYELPSNPMSRIAYPSVSNNRTPKAIDLEDLRAMFAVCREDDMGKRNRAILALLLDSGVRAAGLCGLRPGDVDIAQRRALVTEKRNKTRFVVFSSKTADLLQAWASKRSPLPSYFFYSIRTGYPLTTDGLRNILRAIAHIAGVKGRVNPHSFRHAFAREYIKAGGDLATLSVLMGHNQASTTISHYAIFTDSEIAKRHEAYSPMRLIE